MHFFDYLPRWMSVHFSIIKSIICRHTAIVLPRESIYTSSAAFEWIDVYPLPEHV